MLCSECRSPTVRNQTRTFTLRPRIRRGWQGNEKGRRAGQRQKLKYLTIPSKFSTNLTIRCTASTDVHLSKSPSSADLEANLSSGGPSRLSPYSHAESLLQGVPQFPWAWKSGPKDTKYEESVYMGKLDCNTEDKKKQRPEHRVLQTTESGSDTRRWKYEEVEFCSLYLKENRVNRNSTRIGLTFLRQFHTVRPAGVSYPILLFPFTFCKKGCHMQSSSGEAVKLWISKVLHFPPKT